MVNFPVLAPPHPLDVALAEVGGYRTVMFSRLTGLTFRQVDYLDRTGILSPSVAGANGCGSQRIYSAHDLAVGKVLQRLRALSASRLVCVRVVQTLRRYPIEEWPALVLVDAQGGIHSDLVCDGWFVRLLDETESDIP